jgi:uncharacterized protein (TIGR02246 family)
MRAHSSTEIHTLFQDAFNAGDVEELTSLYEPDAILMVGGKQVKGRENIRAAFHSMCSVGVQMSLTTRSVIESRDGLAILHGEWVVHRTTASEPQPTTQGVSTEVVESRRMAPGYSSSTTLTLRSRNNSPPRVARVYDK